MQPLKYANFLYFWESMIDLKREKSVQRMALVSAIRYSLSTHIWKRKQRVAFAVNEDVLSVEALCTA